MSEQAKPKKGGSMFKVIIIVMLTIILVGGAGFGGYYFATKNGPVTIATEASAAEVTEAFFVATEQSLTTNLADGRFLVIGITVGYDSKNTDLGAEMTEKTDAITDAILSVVRTKKASDLNGMGNDSLKKEILERVNTLLKEGKATNIYFSDFVVQ